MKKLATVTPAYLQSVPRESDCFFILIAKRGKCFEFQGTVKGSSCKWKKKRWKEKEKKNDFATVICLFFFPVTTERIVWGLLISWFSMAWCFFHHTVRIGQINVLKSNIKSHGVRCSNIIFSLAHKTVVHFHSSILNTFSYERKSKKRRRKQIKTKNKRKGPTTEKKRRHAKYYSCLHSCTVGHIGKYQRRKRIENGHRSTLSESEMLKRKQILIKQKSQIRRCAINLDHFQDFFSSSISDP